jgi:hypothetical protein
MVDSSASRLSQADQPDVVRVLTVVAVVPATGEPLKKFAGWPPMPPSVLS